MPCSERPVILKIPLLSRLMASNHVFDNRDSGGCGRKTAYLCPRDGAFQATGWLPGWLVSVLAGLVRLALHWPYAQAEYPPRGDGA